MCEGEGETTKNYTAIRVTTFSLCLEPYTSVGGIYIASSFLIPCCSLCMDMAYGLEKKGAKFKGAISEQLDTKYFHIYWYNDIFEIYVDIMAYCDGEAK